MVALLWRYRLLWMLPLGVLLLLVLVLWFTGDGGGGFRYTVL